MTTLTDVAGKLGVETLDKWYTSEEEMHDEVLRKRYGKLRPANDIAMDVLAKLPVGRFTLEWTQVGLDPEQVWSAYDFAEKQDYEDFHQPFYSGTFEQAVVALAERFLGRE